MSQAYTQKTKTKHYVIWSIKSIQIHRNNLNVFSSVQGIVAVWFSMTFLTSKGVLSVVILLNSLILRYNVKTVFIFQSVIRILASVMFNTPTCREEDNVFDHQIFTLHLHCWDNACCIPFLQPQYLILHLL